jgi:TonB-linked SusC/RagA family outer membrane protein
MRKQVDMLFTSISAQSEIIFNSILRVTALTLLMLVECALSSAQDSLHVKQDTIGITGVVLSNINKPLAGVSISIEGSIQIPVLTNDAGEFRITSMSGKNWIIVSPTGGYKIKRVFINNRDKITIYLTPNDLSSGNDQLNILSQSIAKRNMVASYTDIDVSDIRHSTSLTVDQYMEGRVPGMYVVSRSGDFGSGAFTSMHGINSINTTNQPLYIVDGIPLPLQGIFGSNLAGYSFNQLTGLNPDDVSKMTVVKDPVINSAYGSKGSNGVILIETLDPSVTQTTIDLDLRGGINFSPSRLIPQLNGDQHKSLMNEELFSTGLPEEQIRLMYPDLFLKTSDPNFIDYQHNTNWQSLIFSNSVFSNLNLNVKGGDEIARYGLSFGYNNGNGIIKNTNYQGYNLRFVSRLNIFRWLKMNASVALNSNSSSLKEAGTVDETSPILSSLAKSPLSGPYQYDDQGKQISTLSEVDELGVSNPLAIINNYTATNANNSFVAAVNFETSIKKILVINSKVGIIYNVLKEQIFQPNHGMEHYYDQEAINVAKATNNTLKSFYNNTYLTYSPNLIKGMNLSSVTGLNVQTNNFQLDWGLTKNANPNDKYQALQDGQNNLREIGGQNRVWNWMTVYENVSYSYLDKYFLTGSVSLDGSSRVGTNGLNTYKILGNPYGLFYAGGIAWRLSNESFLKHISWLEDLKLRLTIGKSGNDDIGESSAANYYDAVKYRETVGLFPAVLPNDNLSYETVTQINGGLDISLWGDRLTSNIDIFRAQTNNMLIYSPEQAYLGYDTRAENGGKMENKGVDISFLWRITERKSFKWQLQLNLSLINNKIDAISGGSLISSVDGAEIVNQVGSTANSFYGYIFKGVYSTAAQATAANLVNDKDIAYQAGDAIYKDISGPKGVPDGVINDYDKTSIGSSMPKGFGGLINSFTYKRLTLSIFIQYVFGNKVFNYMRFKDEQMTSLANQSQSVLDRWQYDGQITNVPRALWGDPVGNSDFSTRWIEDGSYVRLKNVTLSYKIPEKFLYFRSAEFYIAVQNIFTLSKYLGYDPEFSYSYLQVSQGIDYGQTPQFRQFMAGIKFGL